MVYYKQLLRCNVILYNNKPVTQIVNINITNETSSLFYKNTIQINT